jgi:hypothetical protein
MLSALSGAGMPPQWERMNMIICDKHGGKLRGDDCPYCRVQELERGIKAIYEDGAPGWGARMRQNLGKLLEEK